MVEEPPLVKMQWLLLKNEQTILDVAGLLGLR